MAENAPASVTARRMTLARALVFATAVVALLMLVASGPGTHADLWSWRIGLLLFQFASNLGIAAAFAAFLVIAFAVHPRFRAGLPLMVLALCIGLAAAAPARIFIGQAHQVPPIHDITTDTQDPPAFVALLDERKKTPNGADYGGPKVAAAQQKAYPDIKPLVLDRPPAEAMQKAIDAARAMGWQIVAADAAAGRLEATARTWWFGFRDDVVVRIRPQGSGSRIDVRSVSRVGSSDVGANAKRVREYLGRLA